ncbi:MAG: hypothetical protein KDK70_44850, partial [Myxococcales bacterium]|nr:hypothetical protein [Myxococcales bacterium]
MDGVDRFRSVLAALLLTATACGDQATPEAAEPEDEGAAAAPSEPSEPSEPAEPEPVAEPAEPPPSGHAVVRVGALLFGTSTGEVGFELPPLGEGPAAPAGVTVNVVGEKDGRLEVETLVAEPPEHHCAGTLEGLDD